MGFRELMSTRKRRLLAGVQIPMHTEALLAQMKGAVQIARHFPFDSPHAFDMFFQIIETYPLLCGILGELKPRDAALFWDTYGEWLLNMVHHPYHRIGSPRIGPAAHRTDEHSLKFATHHLWPSSFWRDKHCYRCFIREIGSRPLQLSTTQCAKHSCQAWAATLLQNLRDKYPSFSVRDLLPEGAGSRSGQSTRRASASRRGSTASPTRSGSNPTPSIPENDIAVSWRKPTNQVTRGNDGVLGNDERMRVSELSTNSTLEAAEKRQLFQDWPTERLLRPRRKTTKRKRKSGAGSTEAERRNESDKSYERKSKIYQINHASSTSQSPGTARTTPESMQSGELFEKPRRYEFRRPRSEWDGKNDHRHTERITLEELEGDIDLLEEENKDLDKLLSQEKKPGQG